MRAFLVLVALAAMLAAPTSASARTQSSVTVDASKYGRILFDGRGFALYTFTRDARGAAPARARARRSGHPTSLAAARLPASVPSARSSERSGGVTGRSRATYAGRPLDATDVSDKKPGQILCQNVSLFGGLGSSSERTGWPVH